MGRLNDVLHKLMLGLFYPAVLGTVFYSYLPYIRDYEEFPGDPFPFFISFGLLIHFCIDYVYTWCVTRYSVIAFLSDLVILFMLYLAFDSVNYLEHEVYYGKISLSLTVVYAMFIVWDFSVRREVSYFWPLVTYEAVAFLFFFGAFIYGLEGMLLVIEILVTSGLLLWFTYKSLLEHSKDVET